MLTDLGHPLLIVSLLLVLWGFVASAMGAARRSQALIESGQRAATSAFVLVTIASLILVRAFVIHDFSIRYVADYSSRSLPLFYTISSFWAGQAGSLLFWVWLLTIYSVVVIWSERRSQNSELLPITLAVLMAVTAFFLILATVSSNPFEKLSFRPEDGRGLNPLLRNPMMVLHPPSLYVGLVGFAVPFAFAMAALASGRLDMQWIRKIRRWTLFAWLLLTIGNLLGAQWAYVELGWGGYWGWDPVENASLLPWLTGTAFFHSIIVQERKGIFKVWNFSLIIVTFALTVLGTFITRSGLISSVHAFGRSSLGPLFLIFLAVLLIVSFGLLFKRLRVLRQTVQLRSILSQEAALLLLNVVFCGMALVVFWGTIFPSISEGLLGKQLTVQTPWFNRMSRPFGVGILALLAICRVMAWGRTPLRRFSRRVFFPMASGIVASAVAVGLGVRHGLALLAYGLAVASVVSMTGDSLRIALVKARTSKMNLLTALARLFGSQRRLYGSYVVHIGAALMFIGIVGSSTFSKSITRTVVPGETIGIGRYALKFEGLKVERVQDRTSVVATVAVTNSGKPVGQMASRKDIYPNYDPVTEVDIRSRLHEDLYFILAGFEQDGRATLQVLVNPLTLWLWIGGGLAILGAIVALLPPRSPRSKIKTNRKEGRP